MGVHFQENWEKTRYESDHILHLNGQEIPYHSVCEDNFFYNDEGKAVATIYSYSYFRSDVEDPSTRPVLFAYNGGPGSASLWLHLGIIGPRRVKLENEMELPTVPPFALEDNPNCLLDICDVVVVDMVGTGLGRLFDESAKEDFYGSDADIRQLAMFVDGWLTRYDRHNSPVLLAGESYGTGRSALLAAELLGGGPDNQDTLGISVSGILLLGSYFFEPTHFPNTALSLPSLAATHWYHKPEGKASLRDFVQESYDFVSNEYVSAFYQGDALSPEKKAAIVEKLAYFTGLDSDYLNQNWQSINTRDYMKLLLKDEHKVVGFYDSRYKWNDLPNIPDANVIADDAAMGQYTPAYQAGFALLRKEMNIAVERRSKGLAHGVNRSWDRKVKRGPGQALALAMRRNPSLQVFFASGLYDLCTTAGNARYLATHNRLDQNRVMIGEYPSGHMAYLGEESAKLLGDDLRTFVMKSTGMK
ncbi:MAG: hypothetical protein J6A26_03220 [Oscillospiraceae bacterium]|nr:hypothetical protein [Oscillospiraceae bacterium]